jgi:hypothetical protein
VHCIRSAVNPSTNQHMRNVLQRSLFCWALVAQLVAGAQSTWQKTYPGLRAATAVVPDFEDGYIIGGTLNNGNGVLLKVSEEGAEQWRTELPAAQGLFLREVRPSAEDRSYYFVATGGFTNYISNHPFFPMNSNWKLPVTGVVGKVNQEHAIAWMKQNILVKGTAATSPLQLRITTGYLLVSGYTSDGKSSVEGFLQVYQRSDGALVKEQKLEQHVQDLIAKDDRVLTLSVVRQKGSYVMALTTYNEQLKKLEEKKTASVVLSSFYSYPVHLLPFNKDPYACAFVHYYGASRVECGCFPVFATNEMSTKAHQLVPNVHCNGGCFFLSHAQDANRDFVLTGLSQTSASNLWAGCRMLWNKYTNDYKKGTTQSYSFAEINKADASVYTHTIGYAIAPTRGGGSIMAGFTTNLTGESNGSFKDRIGWVIKVNADGTW